MLWLIPLFFLTGLACGLVGFALGSGWQVLRTREELATLREAVERSREAGEALRASRAGVVPLTGRQPPSLRGKQGPPGMPVGRVLKWPKEIS